MPANAQRGRYSRGLCAQGDCGERFRNAAVARSRGQHGGGWSDRWSNATKDPVRERSVDRRYLSDFIGDLVVGDTGLEPVTPAM